MTAPTGLLVVGNEEYLRDRAARTYLTRLAAEHGDLTCAVLDAETLTVADIHEHLGPNLFGGLPVATITHGNKMAKPVLDVLIGYVADPDCAVIVDIPKPTEAGGKATIAALQQAGIHTETVAPPKNARDKRTFAQSELRAAGLTATPEAESVLVDGEPDLRGIATRVRQLADDHTTAIEEPRPRITGPQAHAVVSSATVTGFGVADALVARDPRALATATRTALDAGAAPLFIQAACLSTLRDLAALASGAPTRMPPWKAQKLRPALRQWPSSALAGAVHELGVIGETVRSSVRTENDLLAALLRAVTPTRETR